MGGDKQHKHQHVNKIEIHEFRLHCNRGVETSRSCYISKLSSMPEVLGNLTLSRHTEVKSSYRSLVAAWQLGRSLAAPVAIWAVGRSAARTVHLRAPVNKCRNGHGTTTEMGVLFGIKVRKAPLRLLRPPCSASTQIVPDPALHLSRNPPLFHADVL